jgi:type I restriction enzyme S subunit
VTWPVVKFGSLFKVTSGGTPSRSVDEYYEDGQIPWVKTGDLHNKYVEQASEYITEAGLKSSSTRLYPAGTVLVAMYGATIGACSILAIEACTNQACAAFTPNPQVDVNYLYYFLKHSKAAFVNAGAGGAQPNISAGFLKDYEIPLPPLVEQKRIAAILDKADAIRRKRQQAIQLADDFLRAVFLEMFGDPVTNPKGFPVGTIRDLVESASYGTSAKASETEGAFSILRMGNITFNGEIDLSDLKFIDLSEKEQPKYLALKGDLLFNRTNSKELVGKTAVYDRDEPVAIAGYLVRVRANKLGNTHYISGYLNSQHGKATLQGMCKSIVGMANINAQEMQDISIMLPPTELQDKYKEIVLSVRNKTKVLEFSKVQQVALFNSLSKKAFAGQL